MGSSNRVRVAFIPETVYGVTPGSGNFETARFTSETLSATPDTTESQQIRTDRMSSGQIVTGLKVEGELAIELSKESALELFLSSAMYNSWDTKSIITTDLTLDAATGHLTRATGSWASDGIIVGDFATLDNMDDDGNNTQIMVAEIISTTVIRVAGPLTLVDGTGTGTTFKRADKLSIGTTKKSFSMEKAFLDLTTKAINYRGMIVSDLSLNVAYGSLITGSVKFAGNGSEYADQASEFMTNGRTINPPATTRTLNGSIDMPFLASDASGELDSNGFCIQSLALTLANNLTPQNCIGKGAPEDYTEGTAAISIDLSTYLKDGTWGLLEKKLSQDPFAIGFQVKNPDGWLGFYMPAVQVSFDDPNSAGANQQVTLAMKGTAKVGANGESSLTIYRS